MSRPPRGLQPGEDRADRAAGGGVRAPAERVHRGLRRRLERHRAGRAPVHGAGPRRSTCSRTATQPEPGAHVEAGVVRDVQYVGPVTRYHVTLDRGGELQVLAQNLEEGSSEVLEVKGRRVRVAVAPGAGVGNRRIGGRIANEGTQGTRRALGGVRPARRGAQRRRGRLRWRRRRRAAAQHGRSRVSARRSRRSRRTRRRRARSTSSSGPGYAQLVDGVHGSRPAARSTRRTGRRSDDMITLIADGRVRRRLGVGQRERPPDGDGRRRAGRHGPDPELRGRPGGHQGPGVQLASTAQPYGVPHGRGPNYLMFRTDERPGGHRQLERRSGTTRARDVQGQDLDLRRLDLHRGRCASTSRRRSRISGSTNPYQLNEEQFNAAVDLLKKQAPNVGEYWPGDVAKQIQSYHERRQRRRHDVAVPVRPAHGGRPAVPSRRSSRRRARRAGRTPG